MTLYTRARPLLVLGSAAVMAASAAVVGVPAQAGAAGTPGYAITQISLGPHASGAGPAIAVAVNASTDTVYAVRWRDPELFVVDGATGAVTTSIPIGIYTLASTGVVVNPATNTVYVDGAVAGSPGADVVKVIDGSTNAVTSTIPLPNGSQPGGMAVDQVTDTLYVTEETQSSIAVIDGSTNTITGSVILGYHTWPNAVAVDVGTRDVYVTNNNTQDLSVVDGTTDTLVDTIAMPPNAGPCSVAVDPSSDTVYVDAYGSGGGIVQVSGKTDKITNILYTPFGATLGTDAESLAVEPASGTVYAAAPGNTYVIDGATMTGTATVGAGGIAVAIDSTTATEYVAVGEMGTDLVALSPGVSPVITSAATATFTAGRQSSFAVAATGTPDPVFAESGTLPPGVEFAPDGALSGTPGATSGGLYQITITASNTVVPDAVQSFTLAVRQAPSITSARHVTFQTGHKNSFTVHTRGYPVPRLRELGGLPRGIRFVAHRNGTGALEGTPVRADRGRVFVIHIIARNGVGHACIQRFILRIK